MIRHPLLWLLLARANWCIAWHTSAIEYHRLLLREHVERAADLRWKRRAG